MNDMRKTNIIMVGLVIVILIVAYFAIVGVKAKTPDVNDPNDDPTGGDRQPTAYGIIYAKLMVDNAVDRYTGGFEGEPFVTVNDYVSFADEGAIYHNQKFNLLGWFSDDMTAWVVAKITGPGQFLFTWESEHTAFSLSEWGHKYIDFSSGRCYFWDTGSYSVTFQGYADGPSGKYQIGSETITFTVST